MTTSSIYRELAGCRDFGVYRTQRRVGAVAEIHSDRHTRSYGSKDDACTQRELNGATPKDKAKFLDYDASFVTYGEFIGLNATWGLELGLFRRAVSCQEFGELCASAGLSRYERKGNCWDNAWSESFFASLKSECFPENGIFEAKSLARTAIFDYLETFYNRRRLHSSLGYQDYIAR